MNFRLPVYFVDGETVFVFPNIENVFNRGSIIMFNYKDTKHDITQ